MALPFTTMMMRPVHEHEDEKEDEYEEDNGEASHRSHATAPIAGQNQAVSC